MNPLFHNHRPFLKRFVELRLDPNLRARVDPSDIVQEAQYDASRRLDQYLSAPRLPFRLWLRQLAHDRLVMARRRHLKAAKRSVNAEVVLPEGSAAALGQQLLAREPSPDARLDQSELSRRVHAAIDRMLEADREILLLRTFEGLRFQEIAHLLSIDPAAARKRHGRALLRLHKLLAEPP